MDSPPPPNSKHTGFSLVELLAVVALIAMLMAIAIPSVSHITTSSRLTQAGTRVIDEIQQARALALTRNVPVELWLLRIPSATGANDTAWRGIRALSQESDGQASWTSRMSRLPDGIVMTPSADLSNSIGNQTPQTDLPAPLNGVSGVGIRFYPNGRAEPINPTPSLGLGTPLFLTLGHERDFTSSDNTLPSNFITIQIDPRNGRTTSFRP